MKRSETWDDGPVQSGPEGEAPPTARELLDAVQQDTGRPALYAAATLAARVEKVLALLTAIERYAPGDLAKIYRILNGKSE
jgi:hypothetical protein